MPAPKVCKVSGVRADDAERATSRRPSIDAVQAPAIDRCIDAEPGCMIVVACVTWPTVRLGDGRKTAAAVVTIHPS